MKQQGEDRGWSEGAGRGLLLGVAIFSAAMANWTGNANDIVLENDEVRACFDSASGVITRVDDKSSRIELSPASELAENFRLSVLRAVGRTNTILGKEQKLSHIERTADSLAFRWDGPLTDTAGGEHNIAVQMEVTAEGSELRFQLQLQNHSSNKVQEVQYPMIGGLENFGTPGKEPDGVLWLPPATTKKIQSPFEAQTFGYPGQMAFTCVQSAVANRSLYFASHDDVARYKVFHFEEHTNVVATNVFAFVQHLPFTPPGRTFTGSPVVVRVVSGDWHGGASIYRQWFEKTFGICKPADSWLRNESFFLASMFELPEGTINFRFKDIPRWARDAKEHGINSVLISGYHVGGHDNGYPDYSPDPRLGTWKELEAGVKACHKLGVKIYFFVNYQPVMVESDWYKRELYKYHEWPTPEGGVTWNTGWPMGTLWGRMGAPKRMVWADPAFPEFRRIIVEQIARLAKIGADGVHVDKMFPATIDYNPDLPLSPDTAPWEGAIMLTKEVFAACRKYNPNWAMSFECNWDRMMQFTCSTWWGGGFNTAVFPDSVGTQYITSAYDYLGVNNLVAGKCTVQVDPMNFCRALSWKPWEELAKYIKEVKRIQDGLADIVWFGDEIGQTNVQLAGPIAGAYHVFRSRSTSNRACIICNGSRMAKTQTFEGFTSGSGGMVRVHTPFAPAKVAKLPAEILVPGERIVFVEEISNGRLSNKRPAILDSKDDSSLPLPVFSKFNAGKFLRIEDERYLVEVSRKNGAIRRIRDKQGELELIGDSRLADNYRFTLPIPGKEPWQTIEANYIWGKEQKLRSWRDTGTNLTLRWGPPLSNYLGEKFDASATMDVALTTNGILFALKIDNASAYQIGEVFFPLTGGVRGIGRTSAQLKQTLLVRPSASNAVVTSDIFRVFANAPNSWLGDQGPEQYYSFEKDAASSWMELFAPQLDRSVYIGTRDRLQRLPVLRLELVPSYSQTVREDGNWPRRSELKGQPVGVSACFVDFPNSRPGERYEAVPVLINFHEGGATNSAARQGPNSSKDPGLRSRYQKISTTDEH